MFQRLKRLVYLLILNVLVTASTMLAVLTWWDADKQRMSATLDESPAQPRITIIVVGSDAEGTAAAGTLFAPTTPTAEVPAGSPTPSSLEYEVKEGDTLGTIAGEFGISLYDILAVNDLQDPNNLYIGQIILIPTGPLPTLPYTSTPTATSLPSLTNTPRGTLPPTATPTPTLEPTVLTIQRILGAGDLETEQVRITLTGSEELTLTGWQLVDSNANTFIFPRLELFPGGYVQVNTRSGINTATDLFWGLSIAIWQSGETAQLLDETGTIRATFQVP
jgi:LysM repeat protein